MRAQEPSVQSAGGDPTEPQRPGGHAALLTPQARGDQRGCVSGKLSGKNIEGCTTTMHGLRYHHPFF